MIVSEPAGPVGSAEVSMGVVLMPEDPDAPGVDDVGTESVPVTGTEGLGEIRVTEMSIEREGPVGRAELWTGGT